MAGGPDASIATSTTGDQPSLFDDSLEVED